MPGSKRGMTQICNCGEIHPLALPTEPGRAPKKPVRFGSCCSGIEAASVAFGPLGWEAAWFSEIAVFPSRLLAHHYGAGPAERLPDPGPEPVREEPPGADWLRWSEATTLVKAHATIPPCNGIRNLGDLTSLPARVATGEVEKTEVLVGGTPCQSFSIAGKRESMDDARGNLTLTFCELADAISPAVILWENVPGVLTTKDNAFGCFLGALVGSDAPLFPTWKRRGDRFRWTRAGLVVGPKRSAAWRVLDARYFGLAQRRERVFVVACSRASGIDPSEILFERSGLPGDLETRGEERQDLAGTPASRTTGGGGLGTDFDLAGGLQAVGALDASDGGSDENDAEQGRLIPARVAHPLTAGGNLKFDDSRDTLVEVAHTLRGDGFDASEDGTGRGIPLVPVAYGISSDCLDRSGDGAGGTAGERSGLGISHELAQTIRTRPGAVAYSVGIPDVSPALKARDYKGPSSDGDGDGAPLIPVQHRRVLAIQERGREGGRNLEYQADLAYALTAPSGGGRRQEMNVLSFDTTQITHPENRSNPQDGDPCHPLAAAGHPPTIAFSFKDHGQDAGEDLAPTLRAGNGAHANSGMPPAVAFQSRASASNTMNPSEISPTLDMGKSEGMATFSGRGVRRLMPVECERLQGYRDGYTEISDKTPDGPRYKALGNSWAVNVVHWIGKRIHTALRPEAEG